VRTGVGDADADPQGLARPADAEGGAERVQQPVGDRQRLLRPGVGEQDGELVAAEPRRQVVRSDVGAQPVGDGGEDAVTGGVTEGVVDVLEVVEIDETAG
jgi:hypothetical protein